MQNINYQKQLDEILKTIDPVHPPTLLLHSCCAPCSSYVLEYLSGCFQITDFFYNPNIEPEAEYIKRVGELQRLLREMPLVHPVRLVTEPYDSKPFHEAVRGMEALPEGDRRCYVCYELRMRQAARMAAEGGYDYFTTTLSISPHKNAAWINEIGGRLAAEYHVRHLPSDFKKRNGYRRSIELSREYDLYRQDYCGCIYSRRDRDQKRR